MVDQITAEELAETIVAVNEGRRTVADEDEAADLELGPNNCAA